MKNLLYLFPLILLGCWQPEQYVWETLCVQEGNHQFQPYDLTWNDDYAKVYDFRFTDMEYTLYEPDSTVSVDQGDWNKLGGLSFNFANNHNTSIMLGWRWLPGRGAFDLTPYIHHNDQVYNHDFPPAGEFVPSTWFFPDEQFRMELMISDEGVATLNVIIEEIYGGFDRDFYYTYDFGEDGTGNVREIYPWFGGNQTAPDELCMERMLIE